jgi:toxic protein SymE
MAERSERRLKVASFYPPSRPRPWESSPSYGVPEPVPFLRLRGQWLGQAGFEVGERVRVAVEPGRLVIEPVGS